jgi:hypothetical protein
MREKSLDALRAVVRSTFANGPPNGWTLRWDRERFFSELTHLSDPYECANETSFDYSFCNRLVTTIDGQQRSWSLTVRVSFVAPFYSLHWTRYRDSDVRVVPVVPGDIDVIRRRIRRFLDDQGFDELPDDWHDARIEGLKLELAGESEVTIGKCLFEDYES